MGLLDFVRRIFSSRAAKAGDRMLTCIQCRKQFAFEAGEQEFFKERGLSEPKRCPVCRKQNRGAGRFRRRR